MSNHQKMQLGDLNPQTQDQVDWVTLDSFFNVDAPQALAQTLLLTQTIEQLKVMELPEINSTTLINYLSKMARDTEVMAHLLNAMRATYDANKTRYQGRYDENAHMFSISIAYEMQEWLEQYENTVGKSLVDVVEYINKVAPPNQTIVLNK